MTTLSLADIMIMSLSAVAVVVIMSNLYFSLLFIIIKNVIDLNISPFKMVFLISDVSTPNLSDDDTLSSYLSRKLPITILRVSPFVLYVLLMRSYESS